MTAHEGRTIVEWATFGASCTVLAVVIALIAVQFRDTHDPAMPVAITGEVRATGGRFSVDVRVTNEGDDAAANVHVNVSLEIDGATAEGGQTIDFLARDQDAHLTFIFDDDPALGELTVAVTGFADP